MKKIQVLLEIPVANGLESIIAERIESATFGEGSQRLLLHTNGESGEPIVETLHGEITEVRIVEE